jgi:ABC-type branched-subunit amino acid transport system ATPase component
VSKPFGGLQVLKDISFQLSEAEILGLIGPNGAGKSTLFNVITSVYRPDGGTILFHGKDLIGCKPHKVCWRPIGRTFQPVQIRPTMTVIENVLVWAACDEKGGRRRALAEAIECLEVLNLLRLKDMVSNRLTYQ